MKSLMKHWATSLLKPSIPLAVKKDPMQTHLWISQQKKLKYSSTLFDTRLRNLTIDGKLFGKASYWVKDNNALESCKSKTPTSFKSNLNHHHHHQHHHHHYPLHLIMKLQ